MYDESTQPFFFALFQGMQVRAGSRIQCHLATIKPQEGQRRGQGGKAEETKKIKTAPKNSTRTQEEKHEKGKRDKFLPTLFTISIK